MITLGLDAGSLYAKAVLLDGKHVRDHAVVPVTGNLTRQIDPLVELLLSRNELSRQALGGIASTGRGGQRVPGVDLVEDELYCIGQAVRHYLPDVEQVVEIGGQSITTMALDVHGEVLDFMCNDKCASGTGRFLQVMGEALGMDMEQLDEAATRAAEQASISTQCGVFVESEVITHLNAGVDPDHIAAGLCEAAARIVAAQCRRFGGVPGGLALCGGVARLEAVVQRLGQRLDAPCHRLPLDPQLAAALGAALAAAEE